MSPQLNREVCPECIGTGRSTSYRRCPDCIGGRVGYSEYPEPIRLVLSSPCSRCHATGRVNTCEACSGSGYVLRETVAKSFPLPSMYYGGRYEYEKNWYYNKIFFKTFTQNQNGGFDIKGTMITELNFLTSGNFTGLIRSRHIQMEDAVNAKGAIWVGNISDSGLMNGYYFLNGKSVGDWYFGPQKPF